MLKDIKIINKDLLSVRITKRCAGSECCLKQEPERLLKNLKCLCTENKIEKVLINACTTCGLKPDIWAQFELGEKFAEVINGSGIMIGIYGNCNYFTSFTETVAVNRRSTIKVSKNKDEIVEWLDLDMPLS